MAIAFRADASDTIGNGHILRCVTLANALAEQGEQCHFVCRTITEPCRRAVLEGGHHLHLLPQASGTNNRPMAHAPWLQSSWQADAEATHRFLDRMKPTWLVVDHYAIDASWEKHLHTAVRNIAVIDDLADRPHACDLLLDQNLHAQPHLRYDGLVPDGCQRLLGPRYALLRPEFGKGATANPHGDHIMVAFSGADTLHLTQACLEALQGHANVTVVANSQNKDLPSLRHTCAAAGWPLHVDSPHMQQHMQQASLAIGAGGGMVWERAALGLPSIAIIVAENQRQQVLNAEAAGMVLALDGKTLTADRLRESLTTLRADENLRQSMATACRKVVDGRGRLRVAERLRPPVVSMRPALPSDSEKIWTWRNDTAIRGVSRNQDTIPWESHQAWFANVLRNPRQHLLLAADQQGDLGVVRFDVDVPDAEVSIYLAPQRLGQGRGAALLLAAESWLANTRARKLTVCAEVLAGNAASEELFRSCGYGFANGMFRKQVGNNA